MHNQWNVISGLYIHWPFCPYRCSFCPFVAVARHEQFMEQYNRALCTEIEQFCCSNNVKSPIETVFFGGGTPSTWPDALLLDTFAKLKYVFSFSQIQEITIEINPGTVCLEQLNLWKKIGINRLSIGIQSLDDKVLHRLNRLQTKRDVFFLLKHAPGLFDNISIDLIIGLPGVDKKAWKLLLKEVVTWPIKHISLYCLMIHDTTKLYFELKNDAISIPDDDFVADLYDWSVTFLDQHGFGQYEVSNFARAGYESKHNMMYWERKPYKGFGLGACSFDGKCRFQNQKSLIKYIQALQNGQSIMMFEETLTEQQVRLETIMLGLRTVKGVAYTTMMEGLSQDEKICRVKHIELLKANGLMREKNEYLMLTPKGLAIENEIVATFFSGTE